jgi:hypothetical protein
MIMTLNRPQDPFIEVISKLKKIEDYIKVIDYENYPNITSYLNEADYYSDSRYLKDHPSLSKQLQYDNRMMIRARNRDDFIEFCRCVGLQIELILHNFFLELQHKQPDRFKFEKDKYGDLVSVKFDNDQQEINTLRKRLDISLKIIQDISLSKSNKISSVMSNVIKARNIASHRDTKNNTISEKFSSNS